MFCDEVGNKKELRKAATLGLDNKVNDCVWLLGDKHLLSKLSAGDMIAINAVYSSSMPDLAVQESVDCLM